LVDEVLNQFVGGETDLNVLQNAIAIDQVAGGDGVDLALFGERVPLVGAGRAERLGPGDVLVLREELFEIGQRVIAGDADNFEPFGMVLLVEFGEVGERFAAGGDTRWPRNRSGPPFLSARE
jgi:hypothetical protein